MIAVDNNILVYLFTFNEVFSEDVARIVEVDPVWCAPQLWRSEFLSVLSKYVKLKTLTVEEACELYSAANQRMQGQTFMVDQENVLRLACRSKCTSYDCEYVDLALELEVPLVTCDKQVLKQFPEVAVSIKDFVKKAKKK